MVDLRTAAPSPLGDLAGVWKFTAIARWPSNAPQGDLSDASSRKITFDLLKPGTMTLTLPGRSPQVDWLHALTSDLVAYRWNDAAGTYLPLMRAVISKSTDTIDPTSHKVELEATDYRGVLARRTMRAGVTYTNADVGTIAGNLVALGDQPTGYASRLGLNFALCNPDGSPLAATGQLATRTYLFGQVISSALDDLSLCASPVGFNYSVDPDPNNPSATGVVRVFYPYRGVARSVWVAHLGATVTNVSRVIDTTSYASYAAEIGYQAATTAEAFGAGWTDPTDNPEGAWMTVQSQNSVSDATTLQAYANGYVQTYGDLEPAYQLTLAPGRWSPSDAWLGDVVRVIINSGRLKVDNDGQITAVTITLDEQGTETVQLTVGILPMGAPELIRSIDRRLATLGAR